MKPIDFKEQLFVNWAKEYKLSKLQALENKFIGEIAHFKKEIKLSKRMLGLTKTELRKRDKNKACV